MKVRTFFALDVQDIMGPKQFESAVDLGPSR